MISSDLLKTNLDSFVNRITRIYDKIDQAKTFPIYDVRDPKDEEMIYFHSFVIHFHHTLYASMTPFVNQIIFEEANCALKISLRGSMYVLFHNPKQDILFLLNKHYFSQPLQFKWSREWHFGSRLTHYLLYPIPLFKGYDELFMMIQLGGTEVDRQGGFRFWSTPSMWTALLDQFPCIHICLTKKEHEEIQDVIDDRLGIRELANICMMYVNSEYVNDFI